jgi:holo-[acyl-carrier protein] synthase
MAIYGIGTDIVQVSRVAAVMTRTNGRFAEKVLGADELRIYHARQARSAVRGLAFLATRFSAKGSLLESDRPWHALADDLARAADAQRAERQADGGRLGRTGRVAGTRHHGAVTISDEHDYAVSFVIAETADPAGSAAATLPLDPVTP